MKKSISVILCLSLVLCSLFSIGSVAFAAEASTAGNVLSVKTAGFFNDTITYTVYLRSGVTTTGAVVKAVYDTNVLEPVSAGQAEGSPISGLYTAGAVYDRSDMYSIGCLTMSEYKNGSNDTPFMQFTFKVKGDARPLTAVSFYCDQFDSESQPSNEITMGEYDPFYTWSGTTLGTTTGIVANMFEGGITVEWTPTTGATGYIVYKVINGSWTEIGRTTECYYTDFGMVNNTVYQYTVRAYNENGLNSNFEQGATVCYLLAPSSLWLSLSGNSVMASWSAVGGIGSYSLYRRSIKADGTKGEWVHVGTTDRTSFVDSTSSLYNWNNYEYSVCSVMGGNQSPKYRVASIYTNNVPSVTLSLGADGIWYCYTNGAVNYDYSGLVNYSNGWYYVNNGVVDWSYTGLVQYYGVWYYVEYGAVNWNSDTLTYYNDVWYYVKNGTVAWDYTGLVNYIGDWYYVQNGVLNWGVTTLVEYYGTWYYVENSRINWDAVTLVYFNGGWYYVNGGAIDWNYTGLVNYNGNWYYVQNGYLYWGVTTLVEHYGAWYYVENSAINWNYTGLVNYNGNWYYVQNGYLYWGVNTLVEYNGAWYYVENSAINWNYTGLVNYNGNWYYVQNGFLYWGVNTLVEHYGTWYYVENSAINWNYTGSFTYNNYEYYVQNGCVVF